MGRVCPPGNLHNALPGHLRGHGGMQGGDDARRPEALPDGPAPHGTAQEVIQTPLGDLRRVHDEGVDLQEGGEAQTVCPVDAAAGKVVVALHHHVRTEGTDHPAHRGEAQEGERLGPVQIDHREALDQGLFRPKRQVLPRLGSHHLHRMPPGGQPTGHLQGVDRAPQTAGERDAGGDVEDTHGGSYTGFSRKTCVERPWPSGPGWRCSAPGRRVCWPRRTRSPWPSGPRAGHRKPVR